MDLDTLYTRHSAQDSRGRDDCEHPDMTRTHVAGSGTRAVYVWYCPACRMRETEGCED